MARGHICAHNIYWSFSQSSFTPSLCGVHCCWSVFQVQLRLRLLLQTDQEATVSSHPTLPDPIAAGVTYNKSAS